MELRAEFLSAVAETGDGAQRLGPKVPAHAESVTSGPKFLSGRIIPVMRLVSIN